MKANKPKKNDRIVLGKKNEIEREQNFSFFSEKQEINSTYLRVFTTFIETQKLACNFLPRAQQKISAKSGTVRLFFVSLVDKLS